MRSIRGARRLALALPAIVALLAAIAWGVAHLLEVDPDRIERELSSALGREVRLGGELRLEIFPRPAVEASDVTVANPPDRSSPYLVHIDQLRLALGLWPLLQRRLDLVALRIDGADLRLESGPGGADALKSIAGLTGRNADRESPLAVRVERVELRDAHVAWLDVARGEHVTLRIDSLDLVADEYREPIAFQVRGSLRGESFDLEGRGGTLEELLHPSGPWPLSLDGRVGQATIQLGGRVERPTALAGLDLELEIGIPDVGALFARGPARPGLGRARVRGHLVDPEGEAALEHLVVESDPDAELRLHVQGAVRRLAGPSGIELDAGIEADRLRFLELLLDRPLPEGSLRAKLRLSDRNGTIGVHGEAHAASPDGAFRADVSGGFDDLATRDALEARLRATAPSLDALGSAAGLAQELPSVGPVTLGARLRARAGVFGVEDLELEAGQRGGSWLSLRGSVRDLRELRGVALTASVRSQSLASVGRMLRPPRTLPDLGPLDLDARLGDARGPLGVDHFELRGGTPATASVDFAGSVADLRELDALDLEGHLQANDAAFLGSLVGLDLPSTVPARFDGRVRGSEGHLESEGTTSLGRTRIEGRLSAEFGGPGRPRVVGELRSAHVHLEDLGLAGASTPEHRGSGSREPSRRGSERLPFDELRRLDARLDLEAGQVSSEGSVYARDAQVSVVLEDGDLHLRRVVLEYEAGRITGELDVDARTPEPRLALRVDATALDLARLGAALGRPEESGSGLLDLTLDLGSAGASADALRRGLRGRVAFAARDWSVASAFSRQFILGLSHALLPSLRRPPERVGCFRGALEFTGGVGTVGTLVLGGEAVTIVGAGSVDLAGEQWHLELVPKVHDPGLLQVAAAVRVTGPLDAPRFAPVPLDLVAATLRGLVRGALRPARTVTAGAERALGPAGRILSPLRAGLDLARGASGGPDSAACRLPGSAAPTVP